MTSYGPTASVDQDFLELLELIFGSPASLNGSFLTSSSSPCSDDDSNIDVSKWKSAFEKLKTCRHDTINELMLNSVTQ